MTPEQYRAEGRMIAWQGILLIVPMMSGMAWGFLWVGLWILRGPAHEVQAGVLTWIMVVLGIGFCLLGVATGALALLALRDDIRDLMEERGEG